jgi:hypothetical protein
VTWRGWQPVTLGALSETGRESRPGDRETVAGFLYAPTRPVSLPSGPRNNFTWCAVIEIGRAQFTVAGP